MKYTVGVDLGGTKMCAGLVDENYKIIDKVKAPTGAERESGLILADLAAICREVCEKNGVSLADVRFLTDLHCSIRRITWMCWIIRSHC